MYWWHPRPFSFSIRPPIGMLTTYLRLYVVRIMIVPERTLVLIRVLFMYDISSAASVLFRDFDWGQLLANMARGGGRDIHPERIIFLDTYTLWSRVHTSQPKKHISQVHTCFSSLCLMTMLLIFPSIRTSLLCWAQEMMTLERVKCVRSSKRGKCHSKISDYTYWPDSLWNLIFWVFQYNLWRKSSGSQRDRA